MVTFGSLRSDHLPFELLPWWLVSCWLGWRAAATFSSEAHTGVLAIQVTQVSYSQKVPALPCIFPPVLPL